MAAILVAQPAFDDARLFADFTATLQSHGLLRKAEVQEFAKLRSVVGLFAASVMHNCVVRLSDGTTIPLAINIGSSAEKITVSASVEIFDEEFKARTHASGLFLASAIYATNVDASAGCTPELLSRTGPWQFAIELTDKGRLSKLG